VRCFSNYCIDTWSCAVLQWWLPASFIASSVTRVLMLTFSGWKCWRILWSNQNRQS
jgi:hypothetical protein